MYRTTFSFMSNFAFSAFATRALLALAALIFIAGCGTKAPEYDPTANWNAEKLFQDGKTEMNGANWRVCKERFASVEARFPFGVYAQQAQINLAYCQWKDKEPELAIATLNRFQQQYPGNPQTEYVLYLKGVVNFTPPSAVFSNLTGQNPGERDMRAMRQSYAAFTELVALFPEGRYTADARKRLSWLVSTMADNEMLVARFYYDRYAYVAAINRAQLVITEFLGVPAAEPALYIMMMSYEKLGMTEMRNDAERVLLQNFPKTTLITNGFPNKYSAWNPLRLF